MNFDLSDIIKYFPSLFHGTYTYRIIVDSWALFMQLWVYLLIGIILTTIFQAFIDKQKLGDWVKNNPHISIIGAASFGVISPLGTYVCIPLAGSLYSKGTPLGPLMAFLVASPILNPTIFLLTIGAFGYEMAFLRLLAGILLGVITGYVFMFLGKKVGKIPISEEKQQNTFKKNTVHKTFYQKFFEEFKGSTIYMSKYFSIAIIIAAAIKNLITTDQVNWLMGSGSAMSVIFAAGAGIPLYSCGGAAIPVLYQLSEMGMTKGAILAFFISGPSTRISNLVIVNSVFNIRILAIYLAIVLAGAILLGFLYNLV
ncbi:MAG: permease [Paludibacter sp.]|nr:permease [Paludibacter sp.]